MASSIVKRLGMFSQWAAEKTGKSTKTETSTEFKQLQSDTESKGKETATLSLALGLYHELLCKTKDVPSIADGKLLPVVALANAMASLAHTLGDTPYGKALALSSSTHHALAALQREYASTLSISLAAALDRILLDFKEYERLKGKLENRRLDFDARLNKMHKAKKEKPELEEGLKAAQAKYEETLTLLTAQMIALNSNEEDQLHKLMEAMEAKCKYYRQSASEMESLMQQLRVVTGIQQEETASQTPVSSLTAKPLLELSLNDGLRKTGGGGGSSSSVFMPTGSLAHPTPTPAKHIVPSSIPVSYSSISGSHAAAYKPPPSEKQKTAKALFDFTAEQEGELTIHQGDILDVLSVVDEGWWEGRHTLTGQIGMFPSNYVTVVQEPAQPPTDRPFSVMARKSYVDLNQHSSNTQALYKANASSMQSIHHQAPIPSDSTSSMLHGSRSSILSEGGSIHNTRSRTQSNPVSISSDSGKRAEGDRASMLISTSAPSRSSLVSVLSASTVPVCSTCGCEEWAENAFRPGNCNNCFHRHV